MSIFEQLLIERDEWRERALNAEHTLKVTAPKGNRQKRRKKREGRRILKLVSINGKSLPSN